jgi:magnesium and cobalt transporter
MRAGTSSIGIERWLRRTIDSIFHRPADTEGITEYLYDAESRHIIDQDTAAMMEGALLVSEAKVGDIMVPRSQIVFIDEQASPQEFLPGVIASGHSRFPVFDSKREKILGILLAKDLLPLAANHDYEFDIKDSVRPAVFVPESKRLNILLREFRLSRNHLAIVLDEYGEIEGLVSIEDVLEQIVGEIDDEYDVDDEEFVKQHRGNRFTVKARTPVEVFNEAFDSNFSAADYDTVGGIVTNEFGHVPRRGEVCEFGGFEFKVLRADKRRIHVLRVIRLDGDGRSDRD